MCDLGREEAACQSAPLPHSTRDCSGQINPPPPLSPTNNPSPPSLSRLLSAMLPQGDEGVAQQQLSRTAARAPLDK